MNSKDTYEFEKAAETKLETIEWDDLWFEYAPDQARKRILLIGDSITRAFRPFFNNLVRDKGMIGDQVATSKGLDNPFFIPLIDYVIAQQPGYQVINILHGTHAFHIPKEEYRALYARFIAHLREKYPEKKILISSCIPIMDKDDLSRPAARNQVILDRNEVASEVAAEFGLEYLNLYQKILEANAREIVYIGDGVHVQEAGSRLLAEQVYQAVLKNIE